MRTLQTFGRDRNQSDLIIAVISIIFGFMLTAIPFPDWLSDWKPNWIGPFCILLVYYGSPQSWSSFLLFYRHVSRCSAR